MWSKLSVTFIKILWECSDGKWCQTSPFVCARQNNTWGENCGIVFVGTLPLWNLLGKIKGSARRILFHKMKLPTDKKKKKGKGRGQTFWKSSCAECEGTCDRQGAEFPNTTCNLLVCSALAKCWRGTLNPWLMSSEGNKKLLQHKTHSSICKMKLRLK